MIGGLDAEAKATGDKRLRNFAYGEAARLSRKAEGYALEAGAPRRRVGTMRDRHSAAQMELEDGSIT